MSAWLFLPAWDEVVAATLLYGRVANQSGLTPAAPPCACHHVMLGQNRLEDVIVARSELAVRAGFIGHQAAVAGIIGC
jgi:hypothetical protein